jgi:hypothetical protein
MAARPKAMDCWRRRVLLTLLGRRTPSPVVPADGDPGRLVLADPRMPRAVVIPCGAVLAMITVYALVKLAIGLNGGNVDAPILVCSVLGPLALLFVRWTTSFGRRLYLVRGRDFDLRVTQQGHFDALVLKGIHAHARRWRRKHGYPQDRHRLDRGRPGLARRPVVQTRPRERRARAGRSPTRSPGRPAEDDEPPDRLGAGGAA